jgi:RHS repeat-associated protein
MGIWWGATYSNGTPGSSQFLTFTQNYLYTDGLNRLTSATDSGGWSRSFSYDAYGNMTPSGNPAPPSVNFNQNNQIVGASYDQAGNLLSVNGNAVRYDVENRIVSETDGATKAVETYVFDGEGKRVEKYGRYARTIFVYDALGKMAAEYSTAGTASGCSTCYLSPDHLGTPRLITDQNGQLVARHDYLPFGEEVGANQFGRDSTWGTTPDGVNQKFTGKERDAESGLDYFGARYYGSALGRFTSPDKPLLDQFPENPQSWNLYAYGRNNPLNGTDPSGESWSEFWQAFGNCFRYGSCHTTDHIADERENDFLARLQVDGKYLSPSQQEDLKARLFGGLSSADAISRVGALNGAIPHVQQDDKTGVPPLPGQLGQPAQRAQYEDPGHHDPSSPNYIRGKSPIPDDAAEVYNNAIRRGVTRRRVRERSTTARTRMANTIGIAVRTALFIGAAQSQRNKFPIGSEKPLIRSTMRYHNRRIGDRRVFAVEFEFDPKQTTTKDIWGCLWLWAGGRCIGNCQEIEMVDFGLSALVEASASDHSSLAKLSSSPAKDAIDLIMWAVYGDDDAEKEKTLGGDRRSFERFEILPGVTGPFFDNWQAILIDCGSDERFIFRRSQEAPYEFRWPSGTFSKVVGEARDAFRDCLSEARQTGD